MQVNFAHLCDFALMSAEGKLSLIGLFSRIVVPQLPAVLQQSFVAFEIELDYTEIGTPVDVRVEIVDADGAKVIKGTHHVPTQGQGKPGDRALIPQVMRLPPLQFGRAGSYDINIFLGTDVAPKGRITFDIVSTGQPPTPPVQGQPPLPLPPGQ
jgi:hypothetical protein